MRAPAAQQQPACVQPLYAAGLCAPRQQKANAPQQNLEEARGGTVGLACDPASSNTAFGLLISARANCATAAAPPRSAWLTRPCSALASCGNRSFKAEQDLATRAIVLARSSSLCAWRSLASCAATPRSTVPT